MDNDQGKTSPAGRGMGTSGASARMSPQVRLVGLSQMLVLYPFLCLEPSERFLELGFFRRLHQSLVRRTSGIFRLLLIISIGAVSACAFKNPQVGGDANLTVVPASKMPEPEAADLTKAGKPYYVGPYDKLLIDVHGISGLSDREVQVDSSGIIAFPIAGRLDVNGKTIAQIGNLIERQLRENFVREPQVTVSLKEAVGRAVTVEGQVNKPGLYPVPDRTSLLRTMAAAGGLTEFARIDDIVVFRTVQGKRLAALYNLKRIRQGAYPDPDIYPNDVVVVGDSAARRLFKDILQASPVLMAPLFVAVGR